MEALTQYLQNRYNEMASRLETPVKAWKRKDFHDLRLSLKKINALINLVLFSSCEFDAESHFHYFRELFHRAGKIRNLQLEESWMAKHASDEEMDTYKKFNDKKFSKQSKKFKSLVGKKMHGVLQQSFDVLHDALASVSAVQVEHYTRSRRDDIGRFAQQHEFTITELHQFRKLLKDYRYITNALLDPAEKAEEKKDDFVDLLGRWHDSEVLVERLGKLKKRRTLNGAEKQSFEEKSQVAKLQALKLFGAVIHTLHSSPDFLRNLSPLYSNNSGIPEAGALRSTAQRTDSSAYSDED
jgi:hypothetical protein